MGLSLNKKETGTDENAAQGQDKGKQTVLLVVLLVLLGGFGYLYFFTGLIRPQEQPPAPPQPPQVVKQPLPSRSGQPVTAAKAADTAKASQAGVPVAAVPPATVPAKPQQAAAAVKPAETRPAPVVVKQAASPAATAKPDTAKQQQTAQPAKKAPETKLAAVPANGKADQKKDPAAKDSKTAAAVHKNQPAAVPSVKQAKNEKGPWTLVAGLYIVEETLASDLVKLKKAGLTPVVTTGPKRPMTMHRLLYMEYSDKDEAKKAVDMLRKKTGSGFIVQRGGKHEVFAGSYAVLSGAQSEQQQLAAAGIKVSIQKVNVPIVSRKLTAGTYTDRKVLDAAYKKLQAAGVGSPAIE